MSRVFWVRHGPTHAKALVGWTDLAADLSDAPRLARLAAHLPHDAVVVSSDLSRAVTTADAIAHSRARLDPDPDLREIHFGTWEMRNWDTIEDQAHLRRFWDEPGDVRPPGGESWHEVTARVDRATQKLIKAHPDRDLVIVAHLGVILTRVQQALRIGAYEAFSHKIDNLSVTELHHSGGNWQAQVINHLP